MKRLIATFALAALAGCTGTAEFAAMPGTGKLTQTRMMQAKGYCQMATQNSVAYAQGDYFGAFNFAKACFASQGIMVTGFRQKDGRLTAGPIAGPAPANFPARPKAHRKARVAS